MEIQLYYTVARPDKMGTISLLTCKMSDRHKIWLAHPTAKEISKKQYDSLIEYFKSDEYNSTLLKYNK